LPYKRFLFDRPKQSKSSLNGKERKGMHTDDEKTRKKKEKKELEKVYSSKSSVLFKRRRKREHTKKIRNEDQNQQKWLCRSDVPLLQRKHRGSL